jgi:hypothetical protein
MRFSTPWNFRSPNSREHYLLMEATKSSRLGAGVRGKERAREKGKEGEKDGFKER